MTEETPSSHVISPMVVEAPKQLQRLSRVLDLRSAAFSIQASSAGLAVEERPRLTKLLLNVTIQGSVGPVQVIMTPDSTVGDLIAAAVRQYVKEGRRQMLPAAVPSSFDLHYSQFSLESKILSLPQN